MNELDNLNAIELFERSQNLDVNNDFDAELASNFLKECANCKKIVEDYKDEKVRPQKRILADIESKCREALFPVTQADKIVREKLAKWMDRVREQKKAEFEAARLKQLEDTKALLAQKEADELLNGTPDTLIALVQASVNALTDLSAEDMRQTVKTGGATVAQSLVWKWKVVDLDLLPMQFLIVDEKSLNQYCKAYEGHQTPIPGVEFYQETRVSVR